MPPPAAAAAAAHGDPSDDLFAGVRFVLFGFDSVSEAQYRLELIRLGGVDARKYGPSCTHLIVCGCVYDDPVCVAARNDGKVVVTETWIDDSLELGVLADTTRILYRPVKDLDGIAGSDSLHVCLTGYQRKEREEIMRMVSMMGAHFSKPLIANKVTHLICYKFEGEKYELAKRVSIELVNHRWLEDCLEKWKLLPIDNYTKSGWELEIAEAEARDSEEETEIASHRQTPLRTTQQKSPQQRSLTGVASEQRSPQMLARSPAVADHLVNGINKSNSTQHATTETGKVYLSGLASKTDSIGPVETITVTEAVPTRSPAPTVSEVVSANAHGQMPTRSPALAANHQEAVLAKANDQRPIRSPVLTASHQEPVLAKELRSSSQIDQPNTLSNQPTPPSKKSKVAGGVGSSISSMGGSFCSPDIGNADKAKVELTRCEQMPVPSKVSLKPSLPANPGASDISDVVDFQVHHKSPAVANGCQESIPANELSSMDQNGSAGALATSRRRKKTAKVTSPRLGSKMTAAADIGNAGDQLVGKMNTAENSILYSSNLKPTVSLESNTIETTMSTALAEKINGLSNSKNHTMKSASPKASTIGAQDGTRNDESANKTLFVHKDEQHGSKIVESPGLMEVPQKRKNYLPSAHFELPNGTTSIDEFDGFNFSPSGHNKPDNDDEQATAPRCTDSDVVKSKNGSGSVLPQKRKHSVTSRSSQRLKRGQSRADQSKNIILDDMHGELLQDGEIDCPSDKKDADNADGSTKGKRARKNLRLPSKQQGIVETSSKGMSADASNSSGRVAPASMSRVVGKKNHKTVDFFENVGTAVGSVPGANENIDAQMSDAPSADEKNEDTQMADEPAATEKVDRVVNGPSDSNIKGNAVDDHHTNNGVDIVMLSSGTSADCNGSCDLGLPVMRVRKVVAKRKESSSPKKKLSNSLNTASKAYGPSVRSSSRKKAGLLNLEKARASSSRVRDAGRESSDQGHEKKSISDLKAVSVHAELETVACGGAPTSGKPISVVDSDKAPKDEMPRAASSCQASKVYEKSRSKKGKRADPGKSLDPEKVCTSSSGVKDAGKEISGQGCKKNSTSDSKVAKLHEEFEMAACCEALTSGKPSSDGEALKDEMSKANSSCQAGKVNNNPRSKKGKRADSTKSLQPEKENKSEKQISCASKPKSISSTSDLKAAQEKKNKSEKQIGCASKAKSTSTFSGSKAASLHAELEMVACSDVLTSGKPSSDADSDKATKDKMPRAAGSHQAGKVSDKSRSKKGKRADSTKVLDPEKENKLEKQIGCTSKPKSFSAKLSTAASKLLRSSSKPKSSEAGTVAVLTDRRIQASADKSMVALAPEPAWFILTGHRSQRKEYRQILRRLRGRVCRDSHQWSYQATHLIVPEPLRRTEKFFAAAAGGRWILKTDYLTACNQAGKFVDEAPHEWHGSGLIDANTISLEAPRKWRTVRQRTGHGAFYNMRIIIYGTCIAPSLDTLKRAVKAGDGTVLATAPPYARFYSSDIDFAVVPAAMTAPDAVVEEFLKNDIPCVAADYLVEYVCKPGHPLDRHILFNTHDLVEQSFQRLLRRQEEVGSDYAELLEASGGDGDGEDDISCSVCGSREREEVMLICGDDGGSSGCGAAVHIDCCEPPLPAVPDDDWFCASCGNKPETAPKAGSKKRSRR